MSGEPRVLLVRLSCRTSSRGREYLSGFLGCARVVGFKAQEPDKFGNEQWEVFVAEPQQREPQRQLPARRRPPAVIDGRYRDISDDDGSEGPPPWV